MSHTARFDGSSPERVSVAVVLALAEALDTDPVEMGPPLAESVDPHALDALFSDESFDGTLIFHHVGHEIRIDSAGTITIDGGA